MRENAVVLCLVNGPWQALSLAASLSELALDRTARLVPLFVDMPPASALQNAAQRILSANGLPEAFSLPAGIASRRLPGLLEELTRARRFQFDEVALVVSYGLHRPIGRYLAHQAHRARLVIYEEGLRAYVPTRSPWSERARFAAARAAGLFNREFRTAFTPVSAAREKAYCLLLAERLGVPSELRQSVVHHVARERLVRALASLGPTALREKPAMPFVLIVGQYYAELKQMSARDELARYAAAARVIAARGQLPVWRGHLRKRDTFLGPLKAECPELCSFDELVEDPSLPLELHAGLLQQGCAGAVSFSSSALFYLQHLYGIPGYTLLEPTLVQRMRHPHRGACELALHHLPRFALAPAEQSLGELGIGNPAKGS